MAILLLEDEGVQVKCSTSTQGASDFRTMISPDACLPLFMGPGVELQEQKEGSHAEEDPHSG